MDRRVAGYADRFEAIAADPQALLKDPAFLRAYSLSRGERLANLLERHRPVAGQRVLDLGAGYGALAVPLVARGARVVAVDLLDHRVRVTRERARLAGHHRLTVVRIDAFNAPALPFATASFDLVVINGVLEYAGLARADRPERVQARILAEAFRILRPDGMIYWAVENRFSVTYLYGPGHDGLWWSSLLPRRVAQLYSKLAKGTPYVMREPSYFELRRRLREAGFETIRVHGGIMNYNNFTQVLDLEARGAPREVTWPAGGARAARLVLGLGLQRYLWPNFMAIARKQTP
jgi:SAM-dependent methyltransferase